ncbi:hypothetical protein EKH77_17080 [Streptomyces luteoverticillatus]|uniref:Uncharacterized protein n=1 Tax=Streptomyces luteoverticillatus TaxID=66425 RepID=A0A3Q9G0H3_STRLT|nr:hypothetical protein [Streptomyces luteoverticillatus]AZQ72705.1 hypothetical protein EKH77_17080 [Streptomyces luteoverticillatus]
MSRRTDDYDRSARITRDACKYAQREDSDPEFASLILGSMVEQGHREDYGTYPPDGHDFPAGR